MQMLLVVLSVVASVGLALGAASVTLDLICHLLPRTPHQNRAPAGSSHASSGTL